MTLNLHHYMIIDQKPEVVQNPLIFNLKYRKIKR